MKHIFILAILFLGVSGAFGEPKVLEVGEELNYKVYFGFIQLGEVKFKLTDSYKEKGKQVYRAKADIKSYEAIPLVNLHYIFETVMKYDDKDKEIYSETFYSTEFKDKTIIRTEYDFKYDSNAVSIIKENNNHLENYARNKLMQSSRYQDGLSIFYNSRLQSFSNKNFIVPVYVNEKESSVKYSFNINEDVVTANVNDYGISVIKIAGVSDFEGIFGFTGEFAGWFSNDDFRIPVKAQLNVQIGSITLELFSYKRKGWKPPKFEN